MAWERPSFFRSSYGHPFRGLCVGRPSRIVWLVGHRFRSGLGRGEPSIQSPNSGISRRLGRAAVFPSLRAPIFYSAFFLQNLEPLFLYRDGFRRAASDASFSSCCLFAEQYFRGYTFHQPRFFQCGGYSRKTKLVRICLLDMHPRVAFEIMGGFLNLLQIFLQRKATHSSSASRFFSQSSISCSTSIVGTLSFDCLTKPHGPFRRAPPP